MDKLDEFHGGLADFYMDLEDSLFSARGSTGELYAYLQSKFYPAYLSLTNLLEQEPLQAIVEAFEEK